jgi:hypothetical protein
MKWLAKTCALSIVVLTGIVVWMSATRRFDPEPSVPRGLNSAILGIELANSAAEVHGLFGDPSGSHNREVFRGQIYEDWFFIGGYWSLLAGLGGLMAFGTSVKWRVLAVIVVLMTTAAAIFDVFENRGILAMIDRMPQDLDDAVALRTRTASLFKWGCSFAALGLISLMFLSFKSICRACPCCAIGAGVFLFVASVLGLAGLAYNPAISWAVIPLLLGFIFAFLVLAFTPEIFVSWAGAQGHSTGPECAGKRG